jgi:flagellar M-ring protein FliF
MRERLSAVWESIKGFWGRTSKKMRIVYLSGAVVILGFSLAVVMMLNRTDYIILQDNLSSGDLSSITSTLSELGVPYLIEDGRRVMINSNDELFVRMRLAERNYPNSGFTHDLFRQGSTITATQFERERWDQFDLQARLAATIMTYAEVRDASVELGIPRQGNFVLQQDRQVPTANIHVTTVMGRTLTPQQIQGIINLVSSSVPGLLNENITMSDQNGDLRNLLTGSQQAANSKIALAEEINETVRRRIMTMLTPIHGNGNVIVAVDAILDTSHMVSESQIFHPLDPENPRNNPVDYVEEFAEMQNTQGFAQGVPGANDNIDVPQYAGMADDLEGANFYSVQRVYDYLVSSTREQIIREGFEITDMTIAVAVNAAQFPAGMRDQLIDTVAHTAGVPADRVSVQNYVFQPVTAPRDRDIIDNTNLFLISGLGLLALALMVMMLVISVRKKKQRALAAADADAMSLIDDESTLLDLLGQQDEEFEPITIPDTPEMKLKAQIKDLAQSDPEIVANLIKTWLTSA